MCYSSGYSNGDRDLDCGPSFQDCEKEERPAGIVQVSLGQRLFLGALRVGLCSTLLSMTPESSSRDSNIRNISSTVSYICFTHQMTPNMCVVRLDRFVICGCLGGCVASVVDHDDILRFSTPGIQQDLRHDDVMGTFPSH